MVDQKSSTGRTETTQNNALDQFVPIAVQVALDAIPGVGEFFQVLQALDFFVDGIIDPMGYGNTLTRSGIDKTCQTQTNSLKKTLEDPKYVQAIETGVKKIDPNITDKDLSRQVLINQSLYKRVIITPSEYCYSDMINRDVNTTGSKSGAPTDQCESSYREAYYTYFDDNKTRYEQNSIKKSNQFINTLNDLEIVNARNLIEKDKVKYNNEFIVVGTLIGLSFFTVLGIYLYQKHIERKN